MIEDILEGLAPMRPVLLNRTISELLDNLLCQQKWNSSGTRIKWNDQGPHKLVKFGSGIDLEKLEKNELSEFKALKQDKIILLYSAYENPLLIEKEELLNNWKLLDCFIAEKFFLVPYQEISSPQLPSFIECDPLKFIAGHI